MIRVIPPTTLHWEKHVFQCVLGRNGVTDEKWEGDGYTPSGAYSLREIFYRRDRVTNLRTKLPTREITKLDGWCDDPEHELYNRLVRLPINASHEKLWRTDNCYDIIVVLDHNSDPVVPYRGSAIFMHVATAEYRTTEGCVALDRQALETILSGCGQKEVIHIQRTV